MSEVSPYEAPRSRSSIVEGAWRDGLMLVMTKGARLPDRCIACNLPASKRIPIVLIASEGHFAFRRRQVFMPEVCVCRYHFSRLMASVVLVCVGGTVNMALMVLAVRAGGLFTVAESSKDDLMR
jgi:hypothetical protein